MGAATAMGWSTERMIEAFRRTFVASNPLGDFTLPVIALVSGRRVSERLKREFGDVVIEDLPIPFFCVSSNLTTGRTKVHNSGLLWHWLRAAVAIPGVLPPVMAGGEVFVDGATMNNLPVDVMRDLSPGTIVAVDIGSDPDFKPNTDASDIPQWWRAGRWLEIWRRRPNLFQILLRSGMVSSSAVTQMHRDQADLLLQPPLEKIDMLRWRSFDDAIAAGYAHVVERLKQVPPPLAARLHMMPRPAQ
jgi:NTE family protein